MIKMEKWKKMIPILSSSLLLLGISGCSKEEVVERVESKIASIEVPFHWFKKEEVKEKQKKVPTIQGLNLSKEKVPSVEIEHFSNQLNKMSEILSDEESFRAIADGHRNVFEELSSSYFDLRYKEEDDFTKIIQQIGQTPYQFLQSLSLQQYGKMVNEDGTSQIIATIDLNAVNDTEKFLIHPLQLELSNEGKIKNATFVEDSMNRANTRTPLTKNSLLYEDTHLRFAQELKQMIQTLSNPTLYEKILEGGKKSPQTELTALEKKLSMTKKQEVLAKLIQQGKGTFEHWGVTGYLFSDWNIQPLTHYQLTLANEDGLFHYTIEYNRGLNRITDIQIGKLLKERVVKDEEQIEL